MAQVYAIPMCGRYGLFRTDDIKESFDDLVLTVKPTYNAVPTQDMPVITQVARKPAVKVMQWGIPRKLDHNAQQKNLFNTRSEKAFDRFWGKTVKNNRCLVPANGFYEWKTTGSGKVPFWTHLKASDLMYIAGIYDVDNESKSHFSIMTTSPNKEMRDIHNRMPVVLEGKTKYAWLEETDNPGLLEALLAPPRDGVLEAYEVSRDVNNVRNNNPQLIAPV